MDYELEDRSALARIGEEAIERIGLEFSPLLNEHVARGDYTLDDCDLADSWLSTCPRTERFDSLRTNVRHAREKIKRFNSWKTSSGKGTI